MEQTPKRVTINQDFHFDAAHHLPEHDGPCRNVHGHRWDLQVSFEAYIGADGMAIDFKVIKDFINHQVIDELDHKDLNYLIKNPTAENICIWVWDRITAHTLAYLGLEVTLSSICLWESPDSYIEYQGGVV